MQLDLESLKYPIGKFSVPQTLDAEAIQQAIEHIADLPKALFRFKHALTESNPSIKPYDEGSWANLPDASLPAELALDMLRLVHTKWVYLLQNMTAADFERTYYHPEKQRTQYPSQINES